MCLFNMIVQYVTVQYSTAQYSTVQYSTVQHITAEQSRVAQIVAQQSRVDSYRSDQSRIDCSIIDSYRVEQSRSEQSRVEQMSSPCSPGGWRTSGSILGEKTTNRPFRFIIFYLRPFRPPSGSFLCVKPIAIAYIIRQHMVIAIAYETYSYSL